MTKKHVRPFDFSKLKKLSSRHRAVGDALLQRFPQLGEEGESVASLTEVFKKDLGLDLRITPSGLDEIHYSQFIESFSSPCIAVLLKQEPSEQKLVLEIDYVLCHRILDHLLGGSGETPKELLPLSPLEEGILEYLLLKALHQLREMPGVEGVSSLRILKVVNEAKMLLDAIPHEETGCVLKFHFGLGEKGGTLRIYLPHPLVEGTFLREDVMEGVLRPDQKDLLEKRLDRVSHVKTFVWSEIGRVNLRESEKARLEKGDVILFDETFANMGSHGLTGKTVLRVGENSTEGLLAELVDTEGKVVIKVLDYYGG